MVSTVVEREEEFKETLRSVVLELQEKYPSLKSPSDYMLSKGILHLSDPELKRVMGDAYPIRGGADSVFAEILIYYDKRDGVYEVDYRFDFGGSRLPDPLPENVKFQRAIYPRLEVILIAEKFVEGTGFIAEHNRVGEGKYEWSKVTGGSLLGSLEEVKKKIVQYAVKYIENGKANPAPK